jgi:hypothetical protein
MKNIFHLISLSVSFFIIKKKIKINNVIIYYLFLVNQCIHINNIYDKLDSRYDYYFGFTPEILFNFFFLHLVTTKIKHIFIPNFIILLIYFISTKQIKFYIIHYGLLGSVFSFLLYFLAKKSIREIWALFDSFKRSYYNLNQGLLESDPNPIFIISRDKNVLYRNNSALKLIDNILENNSKTQKKSKTPADDRYSNMNFLDIIHPNLKEIFKKLLNDMMEDDKATGFNFPLCKISNQKANIDVSNAFDIFNEKNYLYFFWFRTIICKTEWKGKTAFYIYFFPCEDILLNEIFYQYTKRFSEKIEKVISNSDII